jgi:DNA (cytosine-5)-methyltransferase 1
MVPTIHKTGPWNLSDLKDIKLNGYNVFSCFHCGGGSTMGYKLSGFNVLGGVEIDPEMMKVYKANHNPKQSYLMGVQDFNKIPRNELPKELLNLDILDGSPPCSSFSMAGSREKAWGKNKKFREGQAVQVLDDLFFQFIETARILQPKIVVAENVKGLIMGKAKGYVKQIAQMFNHAGYDTQLFLLNAAFMGVPQRRERTFFIAKRKDLKLPKLDLKFEEKPITVSNAICKIQDNSGEVIKDKKNMDRWVRCVPGKWVKNPKGNNTWGFMRKQNPKEPATTVASTSNLYHWNEPRKLGIKEHIQIQSFPNDFNFIKNEIYMLGMSVPPYMMNRVSKQIELQLLNKLK